MDRRTFLSVVAGSPLVFGLRELLAQEPSPAPDATPDWLKTALQRMKKTRRFGVVIVVPAGKEVRTRLGNALVARLPRDIESSPEDVETFVANVFVCLDEARAQRLTDGKLDGVTRILLDPEGREVEGDQVDLAVYEDASKFRESFRRFVDGGDGSRLRNHAKEIEKSIPADIHKAIEVISRPPRRMETEEAIEELQEAMALVRIRADSIAPWLTHLSRLKENEKTFLQTRLRTIAWDLYLKASAVQPATCLPYGVKFEALPLEDPCPPCGRSSIPTGPALKFLSFLDK